MKKEEWSKNLNLNKICLMMKITKNSFTLLRRKKEK